MMELSELRKLIDETDRQLLRLLEERMQLAVRTGRLKAVVGDPGREEEVLRNVRTSGFGLLGGPFLEALYRIILQESRALQELRPRLAAFQGEHGAWSELAVRRLDPALVAMPCREFRDVFGAVGDGAMDVGVVPVENSIEGPVGEVNDLLVETDLRIVAEVLLPIHHCLLVLPDTDYRELQVVYSHPQALAQCTGFLARHRLDPRPFYDTAGAARWLATERPPSAGVIASGLAAELFGLEIVKEGIEDHAANTTRFLALARSAEGRRGAKCSVVFATPHRAGALVDVLRAFTDEKLNLTRIESRPVRSDPGAFAFLLDFLGAEDDEHVARALARLPELTLNCKVLGFYAEAGAPPPPGVE
jgi:prephenate dehydratase/chorismate mutase/prephenate dehydratase